MSAEALLNENENPTREEIACAIEGNLCRCTGYQQIVDSIEAAAEIKRGTLLHHLLQVILIQIHIQKGLMNHQCHLVMRGDPWLEDIVNNQDASSGAVRKDGKRVAGKQKFPPPGSGGSRPTMAPRDLDSIPESVGGKEPQPAGSHIHDDTEREPKLKAKSTR